MNVPVILGGIGLSFYSLTFMTCSLMIILISMNIRPLKSNVALFLIGNTYLTLLLLATSMLITYGYNQYGNLHPSSWLGGRWCQIRTYLAYVFISAVYYSFVLQAMFRLARIVFYKHKILQSLSVSVTGLVIQWMLSFLFFLIYILLDDLQYLPFEFNCWVAFENIRGLVMLTIFIYGITTSTISLLYMYIIRYIHKRNNTQRRQHSNQRDLTILKRLVILITIVTGAGFPTVVVISIYIYTNRIVAFAYHIQGVSLSIGVFVTAVSLAFITPQIQGMLRRRHRQVHPVSTVAGTVDRSCLVPGTLQP